jgi:hypothetical protein
MILDATKNFAKVTVSTGYSSGDISIVLATGQGAKLPQPLTDGPFNLVWWDSTTYGDPSDDPNVEIVRVTARTADTLAVIRGQEGTSASNKNTSAHTYQMILAPTAKMFTDIQSALAGAGAISSVSNTDGTLTINPTTGAVVASLALGHANTWTGAQTFGDALLVATAPKITTGIKDANGNIIIGFTATGSAVDYLNVANAATANPSTVTLSALGASTNIGLRLQPKGSGYVSFGSGDYLRITADGGANGTIIHANTSTSTEVAMEGYGWNFRSSGGANYLSITEQYAYLIGGSGMLALSSTSPFGWTSSTTARNALDLILTRKGAGNLLLGGPDAAAPVAQTLSVQSVVAGTSNTAGAIYNIVGSLSTGTGVPGRVSIQTSPLSATSATTQNSAVDRFIFGATKVLANNTVTPIANATVASNMVAGGLIRYQVEVFNGTDLQIETGQFIYQVINKGGVFSANTITSAGATGVDVTSNWPVNAVTSGSLVCTWTITAANPAVISLNANSSLTPSTGYPRLTYTIENLAQQAVAVQ